MKEFDGGMPTFETMWSIRNEALAIAIADGIKDQSRAGRFEGFKDRLKEEGLVSAVGYLTLGLRQSSKLPDTPIPDWLFIPGLQSDLRHETSSNDHFVILPASNGRKRDTTLLKDVNGGHPVGAVVRPDAETVDFYVPRGSWCPEGPREASDTEAKNLYHELQFSVRNYSSLLSLGQ